MKAGESSNFWKTVRMVRIFSGSCLQVHRNVPEPQKQTKPYSFEKNQYKGRLPALFHCRNTERTSAKNARLYRYNALHAGSPGQSTSDFLLGDNVCLLQRTWNITRPPSQWSTAMLDEYENFPDPYRNNGTPDTRQKVSTVKVLYLFLPLWKSVLFSWPWIYQFSESPSLTGNIKLSSAPRTSSGLIRSEVATLNDDSLLGNTLSCHQLLSAQAAVYPICTAARNDAVFLAYRVAIPRRRFNVKMHFQPRVVIYIVDHEKVFNHLIII